MTPSKFSELTLKERREYFMDMFMQHMDEGVSTIGIVIATFGEDERSFGYYGELSEADCKALVRNMESHNCHSIHCPMRIEEEIIKAEWDIRRCFEQLRFDKDHHLGMGDIRLTIGMQEEICELVERFYRCT